MKKTRTIFLLAALAFSCSNPSGPESNGANVTIEYYVGSMNFSDAGIYVNGSFLQYVDKNSTAEISVTVGDELQAKYANYEVYPYTGVQQTRSTTAKNGMTWRIP
jgi:hypothetical protein